MEMTQLKCGPKKTKALKSSSHFITNNAQLMVVVERVTSQNCLPMKIQLDWQVNEATWF